MGISGVMGRREFSRRGWGKPTGVFLGLVIMGGTWMLWLGWSSTTPVNHGNAIPKTSGDDPGCVLSSRVEPADASVAHRLTGFYTGNGSQPSPPQIPIDIGVSPQRHSLATVTRFWAVVPGDLRRLAQFLRRAVRYSDIVIVMVRLELDRASSLAYIRDLRETDASFKGVHGFAVSPWGRVVTALNAGLFQAQSLGATLVLFQSLEVMASPQHVSACRERLTANNRVLVAGAALPEAHVFREGQQELNGLSSPWNTFAMWHLQTLSKVGFLAVSEGIVDGVGGEIEEVVTIAMLQRLQKAFGAARSRAELLLMDKHLTWQLDFLTHAEPPQKPGSSAHQREEVKRHWEGRRAKHFLKIRSKKLRAHSQLEALGLLGQATVVHVVPASSVRVKTHIPV